MHDTIYQSVLLSLAAWNAPKEAMAVKNSIIDWHEDVRTSTHNYNYT